MDKSIVAVVFRLFLHPYLMLLRVLAKFLLIV